MSKIKTLIIEDNPGDIELLKLAFKKNKIEGDFIEKEDGQSAIDYLQELKSKNNPGSLPKIVLLDLNLPGKSGHEVLEEIKRDDFFKSMPIIVLTTSDSPDDIQKSYQLYANSYLVKPSDFSQFTEMISALKDYWIQKSKLPN
jgi:CheY-like chemotaxis protein